MPKTLTKPKRLSGAAKTLYEALLGQAVLVRAGAAHWALFNGSLEAGAAGEELLDRRVIAKAQIGARGVLVLGRWHPVVTARIDYAEVEYPLWRPDRLTRRYTPEQLATITSASGKIGEASRRGYLSRRASTAFMASLARFPVAAVVDGLGWFTRYGQAPTVRDALRCVRAVVKRRRGESVR